MATRATAEVREQGGRSIWAQVAMTALTLAILGTLVLWQMRPDGEESTTPVAGGATMTSAPSEATTLAPTDRKAADTMTVYLVGSEEEAAQLTNHWAVLAAVGGVAPQGSEVVLAAGTAEEIALAQQIITYAEMDSRTGSIRVMNLRTP